MSPTNAFTIDVEDYFQVEALSRVIPRESWPDMEYRCERNVHRLLGLLEEKKVHGTFFILGWIAERSPQLIREIAAAGHEIACHGMSHKLIYKQTPGRVPQRNAPLEAVAGRSHRQRRCSVTALPASPS